MVRTTTKFPFPEVDDFQLRELIYEGPHTLVFRGFQSNLNRPVLIKLLKPFIKERKEWIERFQREARVCAQLKHPNIVSVYKLGEKNGYHYIALEFVEGISLKELLAHSTVLPLQVSMSITDQILEALNYVHANKIIHRDMKPGNILIDTHGNARITDFGLAHLGDEVSLTVQGSIIGTPAYMAPEQIVGGTPDGKTDLFSLGTIVYEMITGKQAFGGESYSVCLHKIINEEPPPPTQLNSKLPGNVDSLVEKFLKKDPEERWEDAQQAQENLRRIAAQHKINLGRISTQAFVQPLVSSVSTEGKQLPKTAEQNQLQPTTEGGIRDRFSKRSILSGAFAAVMILVLAAFLWIAQQDSGSVPSHSQTDLILIDSSLVEAESEAGKSSMSKIREDSIVSTPAVSENKEGSDEQGSHQSGFRQKITSGQTMPTDTLLAERSPGGLPKREEVTTMETAETAQLSLWIEPYARVIINEQELDSPVNQTKVSLAPGKHALTFLHPNFLPYSMRVEIQPGEEKTVRWSFLKNAGFLWIEVRPWAEVYIDNQYRDTTPLEKPLALSPGKRLLELKHPQLASYRNYVTIQQGDTLRLQVVLKE